MLGNVSGLHLGLGGALGGREQKGRKRTQLDAAAVVQMFLAKRSGYTGYTGSTLSNSLAAQYGLTAKAVRDIWNMRTWRKVTKPYWNAADHRKVLDKVLCAKCRGQGVAAITAACDECKAKHRKVEMEEDDGQEEEAAADTSAPQVSPHS